MSSASNARSRTRLGSVTTLYAAVAEASHKDVRAGLLVQLELMEATVASLGADLTLLQANLTAYEERRQTLANVAVWATRYRALFLLHEPTDARGREVVRAVLRALNVVIGVGKTAQGVATADLSLEVAGPLPYWETFFKDLDAEALAAMQADLTDPAVMQALAALTDRLQQQRGSLRTLLSSLSSTSAAPSPSAW